MSELTYEGHLHDPIFFATKTAFKITKLKIYLKKRKKSLFQQYFYPKLSKYRFLTGFGKMDSANWESAKWDSANWY